MSANQIDAESFIEIIRSTHGTKVEIRDILTAGKSGAFVAIVDCVGSHDGVYVLKVDSVPQNWTSEEELHRLALEEGAFSKHLPEVVIVERTKKHYCILQRIAGGSLFTWRPLAKALGAFGSAYVKFAELAWTPNLFNFGTQVSLGVLLGEFLGYQLDEAGGGRILDNVRKFLGGEFISAGAFIHCDRVLPNPVLFATSRDTSRLPLIRPLLGPIHGDCHAQNIFVTARSDGSIVDLQLIDLASYKSKGLYFFDHAYLELASLLRHFDGLGEKRWLALTLQLAEVDATEKLEPNERGWCDEITLARSDILPAAARNYPARQDDLLLQYNLAHVAAGMAFLNKRARSGSGSLGISSSQFRQAYVWAASYLARIEALAGVGHASAGPACPVLGGVALEADEGPSEEEWSNARSFDASGFNVLVLGPRSGSSDIPPDVLSLPWSMVVDFDTEGPQDEAISLLDRLFRQTWPGASSPDLKLLTRGGVWYFANGRSDISGAAPTVEPAQWRRRYRRHLEDYISSVAEKIAPPDVRILVLSDGLDADILRWLIEDVDSAFANSLTAVVVAHSQERRAASGLVPAVKTSLNGLLRRIKESRGSAAIDSASPRVPQRVGDQFSLVSFPEEIARRIDRDLTIVHAGLALDFPTSRVFGRDFLRGLTITWAELAQNLDVPRTAYDEYHRKIQDGLEASTNYTVNLLHEPSAGGTTLGLRLAWNFKEQFPVVILDQLSSETASLLRDLFQFTSLPILVVMEANNITESEREGLLEELREDNTRSVFLWISRVFGTSSKEQVLRGKLGSDEASIFFKSYSQQVTDSARIQALVDLTHLPSQQEQRLPFFYGLTAFGEDFFGADQLVQDALANVSDLEKSLIGDLALVSYYTNSGFPLHEFENLCERLNSGKWPIDRLSLLLVADAARVKISHSLLCQKMLAKLARRDEHWRADLFLISENLLRRLRLLEHAQSERIKDMVQALFITRDTESVLQADSDVHAGGIPTHRRFSPLINDFGNVVQSRSALRIVAVQWSGEPHFAAHLARHLLYEEPREVDEAVEIATKALELPKAADDPALVHVKGMTFRVRMEQRLREAKDGALPLQKIEPTVRSDFEEAVSCFEKSTELQVNREHGFVATIQTVSTLFRLSIEIDRCDDLATFLKTNGRQWYLDALAIAENSIEALRNRPRISIRAQKTLAEWDLVYGRIERVVNQLRALAARHEDHSIRRALCVAIIARAKHRWNTIASADLQTITRMMELNIEQQGVRDDDVRRWLGAYRRSRSFDLTKAIERLVDWHNLRGEAVEPPFNLYIFYFLRWLSAPAPREGLAEESVRWLKICRQNHPIGLRAWSYEWLVNTALPLKIEHFNDLGFDPSSIVRGTDPQEKAKLSARLARLTGTMVDYRGPQNATMDLGQGLFVRITPLDRLSQDDQGRRISAYISFSYDGMVGWDASRVD